MKALQESTFTPLPIEERPHDGTGLAKGWTFKTLEHDAHTFPIARK
jgi:hypothetical protein